MKRKRSDEDDEASARQRKTLNAAPTLTLCTLADELIRSILSYFDFYERSKLRFVCRQMRDVLDAMPSQPDSLLDIHLEPSTLEEYRQSPWTITCDKRTSTTRVNIRVLMNVSVSVDDSDNGGTYMYQLPNLPLLKKIRPARLRIDAQQTDVGVDVRLLGHLADAVGETVTSLSIVGLASASQSELQEALSKFEHVERLNVSTLFPLAEAVQILAPLHGLVSLELTLRREMVPEYVVEGQQNLHQVGLHLATLSSLPNLQKLGIHVNDDLKSGGFEIRDTVVASFMRGCASIPNLECLSSDLLDDRQDGSHKAFAFMLRQLEGLQDMSMLYKPTAQLWRAVHDIGRHTTLRRLAIFYEGYWSLEDLQSMVVACNQCFPSLIELELHFAFGGFGTTTSVEVAHVLAGLKSHASLSVLKCGWDQYEGIENMFPVLQRELGDSLGSSIGIIERPLYQFDILST